MNRVLIWDYTGISAQWLDQVADKSDIEVVATMTPKESVPEILLKKNSWDWLLIFEQGMRNFFDTTIQALKLALDMNSWLQKPKSIFALTNWRGGASIFLNFNFSVSRQLNNFVMCTVEECSYVAASADEFRLAHMFTNRVNWASHEMKRFRELAQKYYGVDESTGYFLDLGANIGTTGIYFIKKLAPNLKLIAFEPDTENFKMHKVNIILNDLEAVTDLVNCGLGNEESELMLYRNGNNTGAIGFIEHEQSTPIAAVKIISLDSYLAENKIAAQDVKYIWIDTEGFEPQVILGAKNLLRENPAPIFMECNLNAWRNSGYFDDMLALLAESYSHFIHVQGGDKVYPLDALKTFERPNNALGQIGDIFLIRKGTII